MIIPKETVDYYLAITKALTSAACRDVRALYDSFDWATATADDMVIYRALIQDAAVTAVNTYGTAQAASAAEYFDMLAEAVGSRRRATEMAEVAESSQVAASVHNAACSLFPQESLLEGDSPFGPDPEAFMSQVEGAITRYVTEAGNRTMRANGGDSVRYARMLNDDDPCDICQELASRGFVWGSDEVVYVHDHCKCSMVPGFGRDVEIV